MSGPYRTEVEAAAELMPREVRDLHDAGRVRSGDPERLVRDTVLQHLLAACKAAGVELGDYDRRVLDWLVGQPPTTVQVVIGLIERAHAAGYAEAVARLRDDRRYSNWWSAAGSWQHPPTGRYWDAASRGHLADYLEVVGPDREHMREQAEEEVS